MSPHPNTERERAVERQRTSRRRLGIAVMAVIVCVVPTACGYASAAAPPKTPTPTAAAAGGNGGGNSGGHTGHGGTAATTKPPVPGGNQGNGNQGNGNQGNGNPKPSTPAPTAAPTATPKPPVDPPGNPPSNPPSNPPGNPPNNPPNNGLDVLGRDCKDSGLTPHTGFQIAPACVSTAFGEVADEDKSPSLLITEAPDSVPAGQSFTISVSTRNLVRDRFLGAAAGGYYLESSFLDENGLQRGHFHTACRMLPSTAVAPDSAPVPEFFLATQDNGGGAQPDTVVVTVTGMPTKGTAQCTSWAGDGSHRLPMMQRANQTPAVDSVRITIT